ncbi:MAG: 3-oxo-tetronate kinase [Pyrinomonadaceae bacterium]
MDRLVFAAVADDDTGASDLAGMLADEGLRTLLIIDLPAAEQFMEWSRGQHAVVMAEGTRNLVPAMARERTRAALKLLQARQPHTIQIKYCSTFDSTPAGNIGPMIDAALAELHEEFTVALPALPVNGRTTYRGYHFVNGQLLSDSAMRQHPLTPMTNPNLVDLLGQQTERKVGLASYEVVEAGAAALQACFADLRAQGVGIALVDCLHDVHLDNICRAVEGLRLITGSSAFGIKMPALWRARGLIAEHAAPLPLPVPVTQACGCLIVAGSCSTATLRQNEWLVAQGGSIIRIDPPDLLTDALDRAQLVARARRELAAGRHCLLTASGTADEVQQIQAWGAERGLSVPALGEALAYALADVAREVLSEQRAAGLIAAGGETAGALCRSLSFGALRVGRNIEPGVPLCFSLGRFRLPVVLKSGNFGSADFYGRALQAVASYEEYLRA